MGRAGYDYFRSRGLNDVDMKHFGLGFSPNRWDALLKHLKEKGFSFEEMLMANVVSKGSRPNSYFDRFRNRIMFPIIDVRGNVIAFGGRKLPDSDDKAKYINTSDTPVYKKSHNVYALNSVSYTHLVEDFRQDELSDDDDIIDDFIEGVKEV